MLSTVPQLSHDMANLLSKTGIGSEDRQSTRTSQALVIDEDVSSSMTMKCEWCFTFCHLLLLTLDARRSRAQPDRLTSTISTLTSTPLLITTSAT